MEEDELIAAVLEDGGPTSGKSTKERHLEQVVFGRTEDFEENLDSRKNTIGFSEDVDIASNSEAGKVVDAVWQDEDDLGNLVHIREDRRYKRFRTEDEHRITAELLSKRLRSEFERNIPVPLWAQSSSSKSEDNDNSVESLSRSTGTYVEKSVDRLPLRTFRFKKLTNVNFERPAKGFVHALEFHPTAQMALVGSFGRTVDLFQVDGRSNAKVQSVFFEKFPVSAAHFLDTGNKFLACSKLFPHMFQFDLQSEATVKVPWNRAIPEEGFKSFEVSPNGRFIAFPGKDGAVQLLSGKSIEWIKTFKMNGSVASVAFSGDSKYLYSIGDTGMVYIWDLISRKCHSTFMDDGCVAGTALAASLNNNFLAVGSSTGIVNVYDVKRSFVEKPVLLKTVANLTTCITSLKFNPFSEILALGSNYQDNALKLLHTGEMQVIPSFPASSQQIRQPESMDFSLNSGYFSVGNNKGEAQLFRLFDYKSY